jgi:FkbM family methyltransferase
MRKAGAMFVADWDDYFFDFFSQTQDQFEHNHLDAAMALCTQKRVAIDGGAHVGSWSKTMARSFERVIAFEPNRDNYECLRANVGDNVETMPCGLANRVGVGGMTWENPRNGGAGYLKEGSDFVLVPLDSLFLDNVDFIKFDVEGFELFALQGAARTIERSHPVVLVEQKPQTARFSEWDSAGEWLESRGYTLAAKMNKDYIYTCTQ